MPLRQLGKLGVGSLSPPPWQWEGHSEKRSVPGSKEENWPGQATAAPCPAQFLPRSPLANTHEGIKELPLLTVSVFRFSTEMVAVGTLGHEYS